MAIAREHIATVRSLAQRAAEVVCLGRVVVLAEESERIAADTSAPMRVILVRVGVAEEDVGAMVGRDGKVARALWRIVAAAVWRRKRDGTLPRDLPPVYLSVMSYGERTRRDEAGD